MHIKQLVLDNFKSFGRRTELPFYDDFTTVSGPNGSGKSNIIDAVLFALGLARSTGIRAEKLTDLIYNPGDEGTEGPGEAAVEVVLDNTDRALSRDQVVAAAGTEDVGDVDEIRVKRRVKETEEHYYSYYYLNGRSVNLSAIQDLLSQAGVAPEGYNVVMQGDVTSIISMTPYRRRAILDEIAGVAAFDEKKDAALAELETVKDRIEEAELRIGEKADRLEQLADERETALHYQELRERKTEFEGYLKAAELEDKRGELETTRERIETARAALDARRTELEAVADHVAALEDELEALSREIERKGEDEQLELQRGIETITGEISRIEGEISGAEDRIQEAEADRRAAFVALDRKQEQLDELDAAVRERKLEKASVTVELEDKADERERIEAEIADVGEAYEGRKEALDERRAALDEAKAEKHDRQREQDRLLDEARRRSNERADVQAQLETAEARRPELDAEREDLAAERETSRARLAETEAAVERHRQKKTERGAELATVEDELSAKQAEYAELEAAAAQRGDSSYGRAVTTVLNAGLDGVHGTVGQLGHVEEGYATACETAAGSRLANVVVADDEVGQRGIEYLKANNAGRATFLPITKMDQRSLPRLPNRDGVVDFAYNLVDFDDAYAGVFSYVLGATLVVDDLATARSLMGQYRLVTLDGDLVERSGAMTGGSTRGTRYSFSGSGEGQLQRVAERIAALEAERREHREAVATLEERLEDARDERADAAETVRDVEASLERVADERAALDERVEALEDRLAAIEVERESVAEEMQAIEAAVAEGDEAIAAIRDDIADIEAELADSNIPELTEAAEAVDDEMAALEDRLDAIDGALNERQLERGFVEEAIEGLHDDIEAAQNKKAEQQRRIERLEETIAEKEADLDGKRAAVDELEDELAELKAEREAQREGLREAAAERDDAREAVRAAETELAGLERAAEALTSEIAELEAAVEDYDPEDIPDHDEVVETIDTLATEMAALEPVNMLAIEEYDAVETDLDDLTGRKATLVEEREAIRERIDSYETQKKATFMAAFEGIDEHFREIFGRLSAGSGELHLENPDDPFEAGLTMKAKPRDKPVQRLDAMSGGEKSLTALAFIFAIQRFNPAPFYALDEIDAFLDAANAERVGEMLDELADDAQFIVVTHRSAMLERSERAIGVTMQDDNVSAVTGIAIGDARGDEEAEEELAADGGDEADSP